MSARRGDIEDVKRELALLLASAVFVTALAAVDAEKGGTRATPRPTKVNEFEKMSTTDVGYPVGEVIGHRTMYSTLDQQVKTAVHEIDIVWTQVGDDEATITADLERLVRATRDLLWPQAGPIALPAIPTEPIVIASEEYTQLMPAQQHPFVKGAATRVLIAVETL